MIEFTYELGDEPYLMKVTAWSGRWQAGSVFIREHNQGQVSVGRLCTEPQWRCQHVARRLMEHVIGLYPRAEKWLYAEPFEYPKGRTGPPRQVLERFYGSLGFELAKDGQGRQAMVLRVPRGEV